MLRGVLKAALTKDQVDAGLSLSDEEHFLLLRDKEGKILSVLGIHSTIPIIRREADKYFNHEGLWCPYLDTQPCQFGWCNNCNIYLRV